MQPRQENAMKLQLLGIQSIKQKVRKLLGTIFKSPIYFLKTISHAISKLTVSFLKQSPFSRYFCQVRALTVQ